ncbi:MAG: hypothetical protein LQ342_004742 [Letrouitia transgressa]|nr:MAG: hypothetical protein LQ342_004742 [Letrouitia transgressa]
MESEKKTDEYPWIHSMPCGRHGNRQAWLACVLNRQCRAAIKPIGLNTEIKVPKGFTMAPQNDKPDTSSSQPKDRPVLSERQVALKPVHEAMEAIRIDNARHRVLFRASLRERLILNPLDGKDRKYTARPSVEPSIELPVETQTNVPRDRVSSENGTASPCRMNQAWTIQQGFKNIAFQFGKDRFKGLITTDQRKQMLEKIQRLKGIPDMQVPSVGEFREWLQGKSAALPAKLRPTGKQFDKVVEAYEMCIKHNDDLHWGQVLYHAEPYGKAEIAATGGR